MTVLETTAMLEIAPDTLLNMSSKKSFLREIKIDSVRQPEAETDRYGFWKKALRKDTPKRDASFKRLSRIKIEMGGWVNLPPGTHCVVSLLLEYKDARGLHSCIFDQMDARGATQVLLAGSADFQVQGNIRDIRVYCGGISDRSVWIDNMHIKTSELDTGYMQVAS